MYKKKTLEDLDDFLRNIWLECCGYLSEFDIDGIYYASDIEEEFDFEEEIDFEDELEYDGEDVFLEDENNSTKEGDLSIETRIFSQGIERLENYTNEFMSKIVSNNNDDPDVKSIETSINQTLDQLSDKEFDELEKLAKEFYDEQILNFAKRKKK